MVRLDGNSALTRTATQYIIENTMSLVKTVQDPLVIAIKQMQKDNQADFDKLLNIIDSNAATIKALSTQHHRHNLYEKTGWVKPLTINIGSRIDSVVHNGRSVPKSVAVCCQYVPIIPTIQNILANQKIKKLIQQSYKKSLNTIESFADGSKFNHSPADGNLNLTLALYCDDIEVINPLGANSGIHKLCMYYFSILNLPPELLTHTSHIHLLAVAVVQDVKSIGHNAVLSPFVKDLQDLHRGVLIGNDIVKANLGVVCADNLAANSIINMTESFVAEHCCRFCFLSKEDIQRCCNPPARELLRTSEVQQLYKFSIILVF